MAGRQPTTPTAPVSAVPPEPAQPLDLPAFPVPAGEPRYRTVLSKRLQLSLPLPDRRGWTLERQGSSFLVMHHAATSSTLEVRVWREPENMNRSRCEQKARLVRDLPLRGQEINRRLEELPSRFDSQVDVGFTAGAATEPLGGYVLAFGASARRCFAFAYSTTAAGPGAEQIVADRLVSIDGLTLAGVELRSPIPVPAR
ncbi:MAG: hypothetical protein JRI68_06825 [Deltaproteobacteria bacterium]|nr:hypothetical protein [Deltaproteobacteria bacterium]